MCKTKFRLNNDSHFIKEYQGVFNRRNVTSKTKSNLIIKKTIFICAVTFHITVFKVSLHKIREFKN